MQETWVRSLGWEDPLEKEMATHSSFFAWKISCTEEPGGLQSKGRKESGTTEQLTLTYLVITDTKVGRCYYGRHCIKLIINMYSISFSSYNNLPMLVLLVFPFCKWEDWAQRSDIIFLRSYKLVDLACFLKSLLNLLQYCLFYILVFWLGVGACGILALWSNLHPLHWKVKS